MSARMGLTVLAAAAVLAIAAPAAGAAVPAGPPAAVTAPILPPVPAPDASAAPVLGAAPAFHLITDPPMCILWRAPLGDAVQSRPADGAGDAPVRALGGCGTPCLRATVRSGCAPLPVQ
jgi:hypothetical protein